MKIPFFQRYQNEEVEEFMQQRGKEYHGMLKMGCQRRCCPVPQLVVSLSHIKISTVAAGYAHWYASHLLKFILLKMNSE